MALEDLINEGTEIASDVYVDRMFGTSFINDTKHLSEWSALALMFLQEHYPNHPQVERFEHYVKKADDSLDSCNKMIGILKAFDVIRPTAHNTDYDGILNTIFEKFHTCARQLHRRYSNRPTLKIGDEYDVQDLLNALLRLHFDDVRPEEWTPSYAGGNNRMDFLLKDEEIAIEVKMTRDGLKDKEVGNQLLVDIEKYQAHPNCKRLYCFVYDPDWHIRNPRGLEKDLSKATENIDVKVYIRPLL